MSVKLTSGDPSSFFGPLEGQANIFLSHFDQINWGRVFPTVYFRNWWDDFITAKTRIYCPNIFIVLVAALLIGRRGRDTGQFICVIGCPPELDAHQSGLNWIRVFKTDTSICRLRKWSERGVMAPAIYLQSATRGMNVCLSVTPYRASFKVFLANGMLQQINRLVEAETTRSWFRSTSYV